MKTCDIMSVGDFDSGRTCFHIVFNFGRFPDPYRPSVCECFEKDLKMSEHRTVQLIVHEDTSAGEDYDRLRPLGYNNTNVFIVLYSVASRKSFESVESRWIPEVRHFCPKTPIVIVGNKIDLRGDPNIETISSNEGLELAKKMGTSYYEISAKEMIGIEECFKHAVEIAELNTKAMRKKFNTPSVIIPPIRPMPGPEPVITPAASTFVDDWGKMISNPKFHDVKFLLKCGRSIFAHKLVLCAGSPVFNKLFISKCISESDIASGIVPGIQKVDINEEESTVELSKSIKPKTFDKILEFLYTGTLSEKAKNVDLSDLKQTAKIFEMNELDVECDDAGEKTDLNFEDILKPMNMREYVNGDVFHDCIFNVNGTRIFAHKVVICTRSPKIAETLESSKEVQISDTSVENFTLLLDYLYTDLPDVDASSDLIGLIALANKYGAHRLVTMCEMKLKTMYTLDENNVFGLLQKFKEYKTMQLVDWCRHYISANFSLFEVNGELSSLDVDDNKYIENYRRPFLEYEQVRADFFASLQDKRTKRKCVII